MRNVKVSLIGIFIIILALVAVGCSWPGGGEPEVVIDEESETSDDVVLVTDLGEFALANREELVLDPSELVASEFDGFVDWSPDGKYLAINMSNMTLGSAQTMIVDADTGETKAVISGYNVRWDKKNPSDILFTRHQYYGPPDYGSYEESIRVNQDDLLAAEIFNDDVPHEVIGEDEIVVEGPGWLCEQVLDDEQIICSDYTADEKYIIFIMEKDGQTSLYAMPAVGNVETDALLLVDEGVVVDSFAFNPDKTEIVYKEVHGETDEYGNLEKTTDTTKFIKATINSK
ncbi:hypothetical protein ACFL0Z_03580 [Patescibacteria group bacterium]